MALFILVPTASAADDVDSQKQFREHTANMKRSKKEGTILSGASYGEFGLRSLK